MDRGLLSTLGIFFEYMVEIGNDSLELFVFLKKKDSVNGNPTIVVTRKKEE